MALIPSKSSDASVLRVRRQLQRERKELFAELRPATTKSQWTAEMIAEAMHPERSRRRRFGLSEDSESSINEVSSAAIEGPAGSVGGGDSFNSPRTVDTPTSQDQAPVVGNQKVEWFHRNMVRREAWRQKFDFLYRQMQDECMEAISAEKAAAIAAASPAPPAGVTSCGTAITGGASGSKNGHGVASRRPSASGVEPPGTPGRASAVAAKVHGRPTSRGRPPAPGGGQLRRSPSSSSICRLRPPGGGGGAQPRSFSTPSPNSASEVVGESTNDTQSSMSREKELRERAVAREEANWRRSDSRASSSVGSVCGGGGGVATGGAAFNARAVYVEKPRSASASAVRRRGGEGCGMWQHSRRSIPRPRSSIAVRSVCNSAVAQGGDGGCSETRPASAATSHRLLVASSSEPHLSQELHAVRDEYYGGDELKLREDILHASNPRLFPLRPVPGKFFPLPCLSAC
eukprot:TRINITY_DN16115_c0_g1_i1.p1 TRINITY_DN16115_c0_g1~~TRINITY_DN16115_c0_g1_i1.p1  ORF type:complete len:459 (+),score=86.33 TRINITY_DN16115_c0_g1_i1:169-1545(+)